MKPPLFDLYRIDEDARIKMIGEAAASGKLVGLILDDNEDKVQRYIEKLTSRHPSVGLIDRCKGPTPGVITLRFGPKSGPKVN